MNQRGKRASEQDPLAFLAGGGEMGEFIRAFDWSKTALGAIDSWSQMLRTTVNICLASDLPICVIWGPELVQLYNDGYRVICGGKHPSSMGQNFAECWREAWPVIGEAHDSALSGQTAFLENQHIFLERHGYIEECFFTFSFSPIRDETGRVMGLFHPVIEMTAKMLGERRTRTLRDLAGRTADAKSVQEAFVLATKTLANYALDLPFALIYRLDQKEKNAQLVAATGLSAGMTATPALIELETPRNISWPLAEVARMGMALPVDDVERRFGKLAAGPFPEPIQSAVLLPITPPGTDRPLAVVVAGISPRLLPHEMYGGFFDLVASAITTAVANARAYEEERKRAEALAELDRAKTAFFSNVSHEFRTPLTLMLAPVEDLLSRSHTDLSPAVKGQLEMVNRNGFRLLRLVNTLLDFSRIEAGRVQASYEPTDLAGFTTELASVFRAATERAGLELIVDCPKLPETVYVDRDMWEKIVLNLISNALKFTFEGEIAVSLSEVDRAQWGVNSGEERVGSGEWGARSVTLRVRDTGVGIPAEEMPRLFERFHRIETVRSRTHEGSGIGLALVQELVKLHGGTVRAESVLGHGTTFIVSIPLGRAHLRPERIGAERSRASTATGAAPFVEEALRWLPVDSGQWRADSGERWGTDDRPPVSSRSTAHSPLATRPRVIVADDNADMRQYLARLLSERYDVCPVPDGEAALAAAGERRPDLILADVMMPRLDGVGLVKALRKDGAMRTIPIILLSARAGEESRLEGLDVGADDYVVKPFSARELLARIDSHLQLARLRQETLAQLQASSIKLENARRAAISLMEDAIQSKRAAEKEVAERIQVEHALRESEERHRILINGARDYAIFMLDVEGRVTSWNDGAERVTAYRMEEILGKEHAVFYQEEAQKEGQPAHDLQAAAAAAAAGRYERDEWRVRKDGTPFMANVIVTALRQEDQSLRGFAVVMRDVTDRARQEEALRQWKDELELRVEERTQELVQSQERLRALATELNLAEQRERKRVAAELHDHLQQLLVLGKLKLGQGKRLAQPIPACADIMQQTDDVLADALKYTRTLVAELSPPVLREHGLAAGLKWLAEYMKRRDMTVTVQAPESDDVKLPEDQAVLLFQSARELLINASKHAQSHEATVTLERTNAKLRIEVRDTGVGFDLAAAAPSGGLSSKFGLFSIKERMRALGGSFEIQSAPGQGTAATIMLPLRSSAETRVLSAETSGGTESLQEPVASPFSNSALSPQHSALHQQHAKVRVLLVDDHAMVRQGLRSVLEGYADLEVVGEAWNGEEAVSFVDRLCPSVVVMDINMPRMNGIEATRQIKARYPAICVIGLSVNTGGESREAMVNAGASLLLNKEAAVDELYRAIQETLSNRKVATVID